jgi:hypothetical protein
LIEANHDWKALQEGRPPAKIQPSKWDLLMPHEIHRNWPEAGPYMHRLAEKWAARGARIGT